jgi:replication factor C subunit 1
MDQLVQGANGDMRQVLNMLSTWKLSKDAMDFDEGKQLCEFIPASIELLTNHNSSSLANEKHTIMTPYTVLDKLLGPYSFSKTSRETLNDRIEYYFHDHSFMPLFMQVRHYSLLLSASS